MSLVDSVRKVIVPIHKEGYVFIAIGLVSTIILANLWSPFGWIGAIVTIFLAGLMIAAVFIVWFSLLIRKALHKPASRKPTRPGAAARRRRLEDKKMHGELKRSRRTDIHLDE